LVLSNHGLRFAATIDTINQPRRRADGVGCFGKEFDSGFDTFLTAPKERGIKPIAYNGFA
jgi:hypothetical protein